MLFYHADEAIVQIIQYQLKLAHQHALWLGDKSKTESLHDFRVQLRKIRCWIEVIERNWPTIISSRLFKAIKQLLRSTNWARDAEVEIEWATQLKAVWLIEKLKKRFNEDFEIAKQNMSADYFKIERQLILMLKKLKVDKKNPIAFYDLMQNEIKLVAKQLLKQIKKIKKKKDHLEIHQVRITAKRFRYLLEPFFQNVPVLKNVQDCLGDLHDLYALKKDIYKTKKSPDKKMVLQKIKLEEQRLFDEFKKEHKNHVEEIMSLALSKNLINTSAKIP